MTEMTKDDKELKGCIQCASEIPKGANKCLKCGSFQNFRRFFEFSNNVLALLIALVSVISVSWSNLTGLKNMFNIDLNNLGVATFISDITIETIDVVFENVSTERVWVIGGGFCRINRLKPEHNIFDAGPNLVRYPKGNEVLAVYQLHFARNSGEQGFFVEAGKTATRRFSANRIMLEEGMPFDQEIGELKPYCQTEYKTSSGREGVYWMTLSSVSAAHLALNLEKLPLDAINKSVVGLELPLHSN